MNAKDILDIIWKYLLLVVAVWALIILSCGECPCGFGEDDEFPCSDMKWMHHMPCDNFEIDVEAIADGDSLIIVTIGGEELEEGEEGEVITIQIEGDEVEGLKKKVIRKVIKTDK